MEIDVNEFLEHYGVQGMKWGQRRASNKASVASLRSKGLSKRQAKGTTRYQNKVDAQRMTAMGRQGKVNALKQLQNRGTSNTMLSPSTILRNPLSSKKAAKNQLEKNKVLQQKIGRGEKKVTATLIKLGGVSIKDINYNT